MTNKKEAKRVVTIFAIASFLNDLGSDMIYPVWPLFVTSVLGANMAVLGFIDGLGDALVSISQAFSGYLSDRLRKRKIFIWSGYLFGSISRVGYALSKTWQHLIPFKILDRIGKIRDAPRDAMIADVSTRKNRGRNFGLLRAMDHLGAMCGAVITIFFFSLLGYQKLFLVGAIPSLIGVALILLFIKERKIKGTYRGISLEKITPNLRLFLLLSAIFALGSFSYSFLLVYAKEFGFQTTLIPIFYLAFIGTASFMSLPFGKLSDRLKRKTVLMISYFLFGLMCFIFIFVKSNLGIILSFILYGLHKAGMVPVQRAFVSELSPKKYRASVLGGFQMIVGLCALPASVIAGFLWVSFGMFAPFYFSLCLTILTMILMLFVKE
jgi:MFS family permease